MELSLVVCKLLKLQHHGLLIFLRLDEVAFCLCFALGFVNDILALFLDRVVGVLDKLLIGLLSILLGPDDLSERIIR